jgi:transposase-like protein
METTVKEPQTLQVAILYFGDPDNCLNYMVKHRWPEGVVCPTCGRTDATFLKNQRKWQCRSHHATRQFSAKTGTIFEDSPLGLDKWLTAVWIITTAENGVSSYEIHRALGVTQKTAWFMMHRIRKAMQTGSFIRKLSGHVEVDETFIGGKARFMHKNKRAKVAKRGASGKTIVVGVLERGGKVRAEVVADRERANVQAVVRKHVEPGSQLSTDEWSASFGLAPEYAHQII